MSISSPDNRDFLPTYLPDNTNCVPLMCMPSESVSSELRQRFAGIQSMATAMLRNPSSTATSPTATSVAAVLPLTPPSSFSSPSPSVRSTSVAALRFSNIQRDKLNEIGCLSGLLAQKRADVIKRQSSVIDKLVSEQPAIRRDREQYQLLQIEHAQQSSVLADNMVQLAMYKDRVDQLKNELKSSNAERDSWKQKYLDALDDDDCSFLSEVPPPPIKPGPLCSKPKLKTIKKEPADGKAYSRPEFELKLPNKDAVAITPSSSAFYLDTRNTATIYPGYIQLTDPRAIGTIKVEPSLNEGEPFTYLDAINNNQLTGSSNFTVNMQHFYSYVANTVNPSSVNTSLVNTLIFQTVLHLQRELNLHRV